VDGIPLNPNVIGVGGLLVILFVMLATGRLATSREIHEKNRRIEILEAMVKTKDHQLTIILTEAMTVLSPTLRALRGAAEADDDPGGG